MVVLLQQFAGVLLFVAVAVVLVRAVPGDEPRHRADHTPPTPGVRSAGPDTGPIHLGALHGVTSFIPPMPPRPYTPAAGIPLADVAAAWRASRRALRSADEHGQTGRVQW